MITRLGNGPAKPSGTRRPGAFHAVTEAGKPRHLGPDTFGGPVENVGDALDAARELDVVEHAVRRMYRRAG